MPIPLIIGAAAAAAGLYGAKKGISGALDHQAAKKTNSESEAIVREANQKVETRRESTNQSLEQYGQRKLRAFNGVIADFILTFEQLKNVEIVKSPELEKLTEQDFSQNPLTGLRQDYQALKDAGLGLGAGLSGGAALAFGAYNGTMLLATASTGTAISTLGGVAATNATLAWLGGGSLAAGGYGMAGGMIVLGGIVAGPALAVFGHILGNKGEQALNTALGNLEQAKTLRTESNIIADKLTAIGDVTKLADNTFSTISSHLRNAVHSLKKTIASQGTDFSSFSNEDKEVTYRTVKFAQLIKAMIDTPILDEQGNLVLSTQKRIKEIAVMAADQA
ncbi:hypothetical protein [Marinobacter sp.]|uniref:hypothetical protein n=1 Tax=Marinobacter sp. TaxID=50741 RepID=UPI003A9378A8